jgi:AsmA family protein
VRGSIEQRTVQMSAGNHWNEAEASMFHDYCLAVIHAMKIVGALLAALVAFVGLVASTLALAGPRVVVWAIEHPLSTIAGRKIRIDGPLTLSWGAPARIVAENVHIANAAWASRPDMFTARRVEIDFFPATLLAGPLHITLLSVEHSALMLETPSAGDSNWSFAQRFLTSSRHASVPDINRITLIDGRLSFHNGWSGSDTEITVDRLAVVSRDAAAPVEYTVDGSVQRLKTELAGTIGPLVNLRDADHSYPIDFRGQIGGDRITVAGHASRPIDLEGLDLRVDLSSRDLRDTAAAFGLPLPALPPLHATGRLERSEGKWALRQIAMRLEHSDLAGNADVDTTGKLPHVRADFSANLVDLADFAGFLGASAPASARLPAHAREQSQQRIIPATPIAWRQMVGIDADLALDAKKIETTAGPPLERLRASLELRSGALRAKSLSFGVSGGTVDLGFTLDPETAPPRLSLDLDFQRVDLHRLVTATELPTVFQDTSGIAGGIVHVAGAGVSLRDLFAQVNGDAEIFAENGQFNGLMHKITDLNALEALGLNAKTDTPVTLNCLVSKFNIQHGVATAATLVLDTDASFLVGRGDANLADETLYMDFIPYHKHLTPLALRSPVKVRGLFANPTVRVSKGNILQRLAAALTPGVVTPPSELLSRADRLLGGANACDRAFEARPTQMPAVGSTRSSSSKR